MLRYWTITAAVALAMLAAVAALVRSIGPIPWNTAAAVACGASAAWVALGWWPVWRYARRAAEPLLLARITLWWPGGVAALLALALAFGLCGCQFDTSLLAGLQGNFWGMCSGLSTRSDAGVAGLTVWLTGYLDQVAGLDAAARPLTLRDLWCGDRTAGDDRSAAEDTPASHRKINLEVRPPR